MKGSRIVGLLVLLAWNLACTPSPTCDAREPRPKWCEFAAERARFHSLSFDQRVEFMRGLAFDERVNFAYYLKVKSSGDTIHTSMLEASPKQISVMLIEKLARDKDDNHRLATLSEFSGLPSSAKLGEDPALVKHLRDAFQQLEPANQREAEHYLRPIVPFTKD